MKQFEKNSIFHSWRGKEKKLLFSTHTHTRREKWNLKNSEKLLSKNKRKTKEKNKERIFCKRTKKSICSFGCHHHHRHSSCLFVWISMGKQKKKDCFSNHKGTFKTNKLIFEKKCVGIKFRKKMNEFCNWTSLETVSFLFFNGKKRKQSWKKLQNQQFFGWKDEKRTILCCCCCFVHFFCPKITKQNHFSKEILSF